MKKASDARSKKGTADKKGMRTASTKSMGTQQTAFETFVEAVTTFQNSVQGRLEEMAADQRKIMSYLQQIFEDPEGGIAPFRPMIAGAPIIKMHHVRHEHSYARSQEEEEESEPGSGRTARLGLDRTSLQGDDEEDPPLIVSPAYHSGKEKEALAPYLPEGWPASLTPRSGFEKGGTTSTGISSAELASPHSSMKKGHYDSADMRKQPTLVHSVSMRQKMSAWRLAIDPNSRARNTFDIVGVVVLAYSLTVTPYMLAWNVPLAGLERLCAYIGAFYWTVDLCLNFLTGFFERGELVMNLHLIAKRYASTWLGLDLATVVVDWLTLVEPGHERYRIILLVRVCRLVRSASKLLRLAPRGASRIAFNYGGLFLALLWTTHVVCCLWYNVGRRWDSDTGQHWADEFDAKYGPDVHTRFEYLSSFHWALQQLAAGTMDISPLSSTERLFSIIALAFGWLFGNLVVSSFVLIMTEMQLAQRERSEQLSALERYLHQHNIDQTMRARVQQQVLQKMDVERRLDSDDVHALHHLSEALRLSLKVEIYRPHLMRLPLLRVWDYLMDSALSHLIHRNHVEMKAVDEGELLFEPAEECLELCIIINGGGNYAVEVTAEENDRYEKVHERVVPGQVVSEAVLWSEWIHVGLLQTTALTEVLTISAKDFAKVALGHKQLWDLTRDYAHRFVDRLAAAKPPQSDYPTDLRVPFAEFCEIVSGMDLPSRQTVSIAALDTVRSSTWLMSRKGITELEKEISKGTCVLIQNGDGQVERHVAVTVLRLIREDDEAVLFQLGKFVGNEAEPKCKLPGIKQENGKTVHDSLAKLLEEDLRPIQQDVHVTYMKQESDTKESDSFGITTKYLRTICVAKFRHETQLPDDDDCVYIPRNDVYIIKAGSKRLIYGWIASGQAPNEKELEQRLSGLTLNNDGVDTYSTDEQEIPLLSGINDYDFLDV